MENASLGIIGGADGPTAIFITTDFPMLGLIALAVAAAIGLLIWLKHK